MSEGIKQKRIECGLTQEEFADKLGMQKSAIAKYINGRVENIKRSVISKMASISNCSPCCLMALNKNDYYVEHQEEMEEYNNYFK